MCKKILKKVKKKRKNLVISKKSSTFARFFRFYTIFLGQKRVADFTR